MQARVDNPEGVTSTLPLLLASRSLRRRLLLSQHGFDHVAIHPGFEDGVLEPGGVTPTQWVQALATLKAHAGAALPEAVGRVVLAADTACLLDGKLIGTPRTTEEARNMLQAFQGREHQVLTGVALLDLRSFVVPPAALDEEHRYGFVDVAHVRVGTIEQDALEAYLSGGHWQGKAGAYNLSERLEAGWPLTFSGDPTTIMGLPMRRLSALLTRLVATRPPHAS